MNAHSQELLNDANGNRTDKILEDLKHYALDLNPSDK